MKWDLLDLMVCAMREVMPSGWLRTKPDTKSMHADKNRPSSSWCGSFCVLQVCDYKEEGGRQISGAPAYFQCDAYTDLEA